MPLTITYRIFRSWTNRSRSFVPIPRRRAASDALKSSAAIFTSGLIEAKFTAEKGCLVLDLCKYCQMITVGEHITSVFKRSQQL